MKTMVKSARQILFLQHDSLKQELDEMPFFHWQSLGMTVQEFLDFSQETGMTVDKPSDQSDEYNFLHCLWLLLKLDSFIRKVKEENLSDADILLEKLSS